MCLDPGETTGYASFWHGHLIRYGEHVTGDDPAEMVSLIQWKLSMEDVSDTPAFRGHQYDASTQSLEHLVYEEYRIRSTKARQHIGSEVWTIQHIGAIRATASALGVPTTKQTPGEAKKFATDRKLRQWGLYQPNMRHANDAIRHGVYWHLFKYGRTRPSVGRGLPSRHRGEDQPD